MTTTNASTGEITGTTEYKYTTLSGKLTRLEYNDLEWNYECLLGRIPAKCVPIAEVEGGDLICMSLQPGSFGSVYYWDHDTMDVDTGDMCDYGVEELLAVASSFSELIEKIDPV